MDNLNKEELLKAGLEYLDLALTHIMEIKGCAKGAALAKIIHGAFVLGETIYDGYKK